MYLHVEFIYIIFWFRKWQKVDTIQTVIDPVCDVAFAPSIGRSYHVLAVASRNLHIFEMRPMQTNAISTVSDSILSNDGSNMISKFDTKELASFDDHGGQV